MNQIKIMSGAIAILALVLPHGLRADEGLPPFSWERVPLFMHLGKQSDDLTPKQLDFLTRHYSFITLEKQFAVRKRGSTEAGIAEAARQIKKRNPNAKVLFYLNSLLDVPGYKSSASFPADGHLEKRSGKPNTRGGGKILTFDHSRADVRAWWSDVAAKAVSEGSCDGVFVDTVGGITGKGLIKVIGQQKFDDLNRGFVETLKETRRKIGPNKLIIFNGIKDGKHFELLPYANGAMIEHFGGINITAKKETIAGDLEAMRNAARLGKIVELKAWPGFDWTNDEMMKKPRSELVQLARQRLEFQLACFLVAAERGCYFNYSWSYNEKNGPFEWYPEFDKPLGPPKGDAKRDGWKYTREFERASVFVDLEKMTAKIDWK